MNAFDKSQKPAVTRTLKISDIIEHQEKLQVRVAIDPKTVEQYARSMDRGTEFPPVTVFRIDGQNYLVDGFHRVEATRTVANAKGNYTPKVKAEVIEGTMKEAMRAAALANTAHGKRLTRSDHRRAFRMLASSGALNDMDSRSIAELMNHVVSHVTIWNWAKADFPGLLVSKRGKGEKPDINQTREVDQLSASLIERETVVSALAQASRVVEKITDEEALDDIARWAKRVLDAAVERGGDPEREYDPF